MPPFNFRSQMHASFSRTGKLWARHSRPWWTKMATHISTQRWATSNLPSHTTLGRTHTSPSSLHSQLLSEKMLYQGCLENLKRPSLRSNLTICSSSEHQATQPNTSTLRPSCLGKNQERLWSWAEKMKGLSISDLVAKVWRAPYSANGILISSL